MKLNDLRDNPGARQARSRVGRGIGSGKGQTAGRGDKGQKSRSGVSLRGFEGGQMPLYRRLPKRGFHNPFRKDYQEINLGTLQQAIDAGVLDAGKTIDDAAFRAAGLMKKRRDGVRLLGKGALKAKLTLEVAGASKGAISAIEAAGGSVTVTAKPPADQPTKKERRTARRQARKNKGAKGGGGAQPPPEKKQDKKAEKKAETKPRTKPQTNNVEGDG